MNHDENGQCCERLREMTSGKDNRKREKERERNAKVSIIWKSSCDEIISLEKQK